MFNNFEQANISYDGAIEPIYANGVYFVSTHAIFSGDSPLIWRAPMATKLIKEFLTRVKWPELDYLLIDLPPGTGDIHLTLVQQANLTAAIIVTTPQEVACAITEKGLQMFNKVNVPILGIIENMSVFNCDNCGHEHHIFNKDGASKLAEKYSTNLLGKLPLVSSINEKGSNNSSIFETIPDSVIAKEYASITKKVIKLIEKDIEQNIAPIDCTIKSSKLHIIWQNENMHIIDGYDLRIKCPCAVCKPKQKEEQSHITKKIHIMGLSHVGNYGIKLSFSDGHNTGIFSYNLISQIAKNSA